MIWGVCCPVSCHVSLTPLSDAPHTGVSLWPLLIDLLIWSCYISLLRLHNPTALSLLILKSSHILILNYSISLVTLPHLPPFLFFNWWKLEAAIKEKQKDLVKANSFLDLALSYFNPKFSVAVEEELEGIMILYRLSMIFQCSAAHSLSRLTFSVFLQASFLCLHSLQPCGYD